LNAQNVHPIEICCQLIAVGVMDESNVRKWCGIFNEGRTNVHDEQSRCLSLITEDLKSRIDQHILEKNIRETNTRMKTLHLGQ
jgi:hypothetical protein